ncbi:MAG: aldolase/citrate lyase family protein [Phyllobacterium sp.]|uniref:aldolase/citrate lyase family protein n=1 Tax=Phyllobacterium sp. TaxID=1871046 RepID=UPI0030EFFD9E
MTKPSRLRRSVLYVPASNAKALAKVASLQADAVIFDLEDAVAPEAKETSREALRNYFLVHPPRTAERVIRINALDGEWGAEDLLAARACKPDAILLPKVQTPQDVTNVADVLDDTDASEGIRLWAMIETPRGILNVDAIAELGLRSTARLDCVVVGTNDIAKETGTRLKAGRAFFAPWLMQVLLCARAGKLDVIDGVFNDFANFDGFSAECAEAAQMGFDGKSLIHPAQIEPANAAFLPDEQTLGEARAIVAAFARPENSGKGVIALSGRMVERLHLESAQKLVTKVDALGRNWEKPDRFAPNMGNITMKLYRFLTGPDDASFCHKVTAAINKGWHIYGSPTYAFNSVTGVMQCGQAVVKDVDGVDYEPSIKLSDF